MLSSPLPPLNALPEELAHHEKVGLDIPDREPLTVDEFVRHRASLASSQPVISYPRAGIEYVDYPLRQLDVFAFRVAKAITAQAPPRKVSSEKPAVIALLGPSNLDYLVMLLAVTKLGHAGLLLSTSISTEAYASLLEKTGSKHIFVHASLRQTAEVLRLRIPGLHIDEIPTQEVYDYPAPCDVDTNLTPHLDSEVESQHIAWIIHSSGSTGLPKPIFQTQRAVLKNYAGNMNMSGFITLPLYHNHGLSCLFRTVHSCKTLRLYSADLPLTKQYLLDIMRSHELEIFYGVPYALKLLAETDEGIAVLAKLKAVMFGGSACPDSLGDRLVQNGVNLISHYGTTETGQLMTSFRPVGDKGWDWVRPSDAVRKYLAFEERSPGIFELVVLDGWPSKVMSNRPDGSYATKDLFLKHPAIEAYKYYARLDDTIVLVNGEKVNPLDMEGRVRQHDAVSEAVVFGAGRACIGLVVIRAPGADDLSDAEIIEGIWTAVEQAHGAMPAFGQLSRSMVRVLPSDTQYPRTDKGTVIRQAFYRTFGNLIEEAYEAEDAVTGTLILSEHDLRDFVREQLRNLLPLKEPGALTDDADFFTLGMDSLQAAQLRSVLLKTVNTSGHRLGLNVTFEHPTINALTRYLSALGSGDSGAVESIEDRMDALISKYSQFKKHEPLPNERQGRYVVVTGATGSLGSHVVAKLSVLEDVQKVYCLIRAASTAEADDRLRNSLRARKVYDGLSDAVRSKLVALPSDLSQPTLGLTSSTYDTLMMEVTDVIHCAWSVNFNMQLSSFERDSIGGLKNLIDLCLKSQRPAPASFNFCSSVSAVVNTDGEHIPEALPQKLSDAQNMGYAQSKLVGEHICIQAAQHTGLRARVLRIGQVIGDQHHGIWNPTEAIPLILQCATTIHALPALDESPRWLPVDTVAGAVIDLSLRSNENPHLVFHIVSPHPFHWTRDLLPCLRSAGLAFEELPPREWIRRLRGSHPDPAVNPPIKLLDFFASKYDTEQPRRSLRWSTAKASEVSSTLAQARPLDQALVAKMVEYFRRECWSASAARVVN
ncbi:putative NRPS-like enzyme [Aspergillus clavatus NRRL 1]|uniref:NRPS-like enzyme, putative n=1 Tax=Aspergillus clavatus (strain ATCC 1007 / CBS 513.65 / DSM 816 / NCTC 3887 / NRRL 1 / QM 1276 / 107) TaxID=344612 RepID=A1CTQ3_ASPCL|nr:NRPS-like enzyme, putative [Aspergillus clavatus NRRL 1]EAW06690.1 NRPS-like enzyme, putative [Aspergillus clavatus NRRL 1]